mmetsp:Transcript_65097/g.74804  ORF Transcript_65097/g.74804 Transcript_65097/m.74804 type:complete len:554 (+) Transcript_65097:222-1883(+)
MGSASSSAKGKKKKAAVTAKQTKVSKTWNESKQAEHVEVRPGVSGEKQEYNANGNDQTGAQNKSHSQGGENIQEVQRGTNIADRQRQQQGFIEPDRSRVANIHGSNSKWKKGELIGSGAYGKVYKSLELDTGKMVAIKEVALQGNMNQIQAEIASLKSEISLLKELSHKNIVKYFQTEISPEGTAVEIVLEYLPGGSLKSVLDTYGPLIEKVARNYTEQILEGLEYLHQHGVIHRDLKCANILLSHDGIVKVSDFGASKKIISATMVNIEEAFQKSKSLKGSPYWMAPEVVKRVGHSNPADIWGLGCTVIEMLQGTPPWSDLSKNARQVLSLIVSTKTGPQLPDGISDLCRDFLVKCLQLNPSQRLTASQLLNHPWITSVYSYAEQQSRIAQRQNRPLTPQRVTPTATTTTSNTTTTTTPITTTKTPTTKPKITSKPSTKTPTTTNKPQKTSTTTPITKTTTSSSLSSTNQTSSPTKRTNQLYPQVYDEGDDGGEFEGSASMSRDNEFIGSAYAVKMRNQAEEERRRKQMLEETKRREWEIELERARREMKKM